jgi:adenosylcobinamide-phosphate synthase
MAGALGVTLGGENAYAGHVETRPVLGLGGRPVRVDDLRRAVRLGRVSAALAGALAVGVSLGAAQALAAAGRRGAFGVACRRTGAREPGRSPAGSGG